MQRSIALFIVALLLVINATLAQQVAEITIFRDSNSLTVYIPAGGVTSLEGIGFEVSTGTEVISTLLSNYPSFAGLPFNSLPTPVCLRLVRANVDAPLPIACPTQDNLFIQILVDADVFWFDSVLGDRTLDVTQNSVTLGFCGAGSPTCVIPVRAVVAAPTPIGGGTSGQIAFRSERDGNGEIYLMSVDGSNPINLTNNLNDDAYPS